MENTNAAIIEELKNSVRRIREELGELESRLSELQPEKAGADKLFFESVMPDILPWKVDVPGAAVHNILSAISLNDRVLFIKALFDGDPLLFQDSISAFNGMSCLAEAEAYIAEHFTKWKMDSDVVYRFMMAVRRKLS